MAAVVLFAACSSSGGTGPLDALRRRLGRGRRRDHRSATCRRTSSTSTSPPRRPASTRPPPRSGSTVIQVGPNEPKADLQVPFIKDLTTQKVDSIIISADDKDAVAPDLKAAMAPGIKVVGFDSSPAVGAYNVFVNQVDFSGVGVNLADWACELAPSCTGDIAILSAAATATNQNAWIDLMKKTLATDAKYKGLKLVDTVYGDDKHREHDAGPGPADQVPEPQGHRRPDDGRHPRGRPGRLARPEVRPRQGHRPRLPERHEAVRQGRHLPGLRAVERSGPRLPRRTRSRPKLVSGEITGKEGETFTVKGLNDDQPYTIGKDSIVILGPAFRFDSTNVDQFNF